MQLTKLGNALKAIVKRNMTAEEVDNTICRFRVRSVQNFRSVHGQDDFLQEGEHDVTGDMFLNLLASKACVVMVRIFTMHDNLL